MEVLEQREIRLEWVARVLAEPLLVRDDPKDPSLVQAFGRIRERDGRVLRVVYTQNEGSIYLVTVFFDRSMKGKL
ncbi:MAG: DUF4258 domain-containing protein [Actinobacteria bacterium]|nr:DUF4258 domain-containing protein [Actinomycetota bacterium]